MENPPQPSPLLDAIARAVKHGTPRPIPMDLTRNGKPVGGLLVFTSHAKMEEAIRILDRFLATDETQTKTTTQTKDPAA